MLLSGLSILIADDEPEIRDLLAEEIKDRGATVMSVENGKLAWKALCENKFDVLLSDVRMPGGDGIELIKKISSELQTKPLVFLCTGYADLTMQEAKKHGVVEVFSKPFDIDNISNTIAKSILLSKSR